MRTAIFIIGYLFYQLLSEYLGIKIIDNEKNGLIYLFLFFIVLDCVKEK